jgi:protein TonB
MEMKRFLIISGILHAVVLVVVPLIPQLRRDAPTAMDVYAVELLDATAAAAGQAAPAAEEPEQVPEPAPEQAAPKEEPPKDVISEEPRKPAPRKVATPPRPEKTLAQRLEERLNAEDQKRSSEPAATEQPARAAVQGQPSPGAQRTSITVSRFPYAWYIGVIQGKVSSNWKQPSDRLVTEESLTARISFRIGRDGSVSAVTVRRSSGRTTIDQSASKAVRSAAPFPPLPSDYRESYLDVTIDFTVERE